MHRLSEINAESRTGVCSICGDVKLKSKGNGKFRCFTKVYQERKRYPSFKKSQMRTSVNAAKRKKVRINELKKVGCMDCGRSDGPSACYEFDHREGTIKLFEIGSGYMGHGWGAILIEIDKCDIVCVFCHRVRTETRAGRWPLSQPVST